MHEYTKTFVPSWDFCCTVVNKLSYEKLETKLTITATTFLSLSYLSALSNSIETPEPPGYKMFWFISPYTTPQ